MGEEVDDVTVGSAEEDSSMREPSPSPMEVVRWRLRGFRKGGMEEIVEEEEEEEEEEEGSTKPSIFSKTKFIPHFSNLQDFDVPDVT